MREFYAGKGVFLVDVHQFVFGPGVLGRGVAFQAEALGEGRSGLGVEHQVRHRAAFQRQARGFRRAVLGDAPLARARRVQDEQRRPALLQALQEPDCDIDNRIRPFQATPLRLAATGADQGCSFFCLSDVCVLTLCDSVSMLQNDV